MIPLGILAASAPKVSGSYELIATVNGTNNTVISLSGIPANTYKHLEIRYTLRNGGATNANLRMTLNSSATGYAYHDLTGNGTSVTSSVSTSATFIEFTGAAAGNTTTASVFGAGVISILDYSSTTKNKTIRGLYGKVVTSLYTIALRSGLWANTAAVTQITFQMQSGTMGTGSRFSLYGIKG